ncbi:MAG: hypothetical protein JNL81_13140 [Hyphomonadaceae bacterium]|nr:hypothetical protein [Hyphomonadaceae bacterium]
MATRRNAAAALLATSLALLCSADALGADRPLTVRQFAGQVDGSLLVRDMEPRSNYRMTPFRSYGRVRVEFENAQISSNCDASPLTNFLRRLLVQQTRSAGIALRLTTSGGTAAAADPAAPPPAAPAIGTLPGAASDRIVLFAGNLLRVSSEERNGRRCRVQLDTGGAYTPLLDLRGQPRPVHVEFLIWTSRENAPGFIPSTLIDLYSTKALAPLTRDQVRGYAASLITMFDNAREGLIARTLNFEQTPAEYGVSLVFDPTDRLARGSRINVSMQTTSSMFWAGGASEANFQDISAADVLSTTIGPRTTIQSALDAIPTAQYSKWTGVRPTDTDFTDLEAGCAAIEQRVGQVGLTGEDQVIARWAAVAQHPAMRQAAQRFAGTTCLRGLRTQLERMGVRQPTYFTIPSEAPPAPPRQADQADMARFMSTRFRPYVRTRQDEGRQQLADTVLASGAQIVVSQEFNAVQPAIAANGAITGSFDRISCFAYTPFVANAGVTGSRIEGVAELVGGTETYFRAFFNQASDANALRMTRVEFNATLPNAARDRLQDANPDHCENAWRPRMLYPPQPQPPQQ